MNRISNWHIIVLSIMAALSLTVFFGVNLAGNAVILGVIFFFIDYKISKRYGKDSYLELTAFTHKLKGGKIWVWIIVPVLLNAICIYAAKLFVPEFIEHVLSRTKHLLSPDKIFLLIIQVIILALLEEMAWRGFFQKRLQRLFPIAPVLLITSFLFSIGHMASGNIGLVTYDLFFIFLNSIVYGVIFLKTNNVWASTISHILANLFAVFILFFI